LYPYHTLNHHIVATRRKVNVHHLDSPIARQDIRLDITDLYVFRGETGTVFAINVCHSFSAHPYPGYHPEGMYEFKVDLNGDAVEDVTYRLTFDERDEHGKQRYVVRCIKGAAAPDRMRGARLLPRDHGRDCNHEIRPAGEGWQGRRSFLD